MMTFAAGLFWGYSFGELAIGLVLVMAIVALIYIACQVFKVTIPGWIVQVFWVCVAAVILIAAIRFIMSL